MFDALTEMRKAKFLFNMALQVCPRDEGGRFEPAAVLLEMRVHAKRYGFSEDHSSFIPDNLRNRLKEVYRSTSSSALAAASSKRQRG